MLQPDLSVKSRRIIISGGGTGGHIFPAIAIANALMTLNPTNELLFVGANGKMEMEKVPAAGYSIIGLDIQGIQRSLSLTNLMFPYKLVKSFLKAISIISKFKPDVAVGVGGYASGPLLYAASLRGIPYLLQEQNSYPGITNKSLAARAAKICVAFTGMDVFFPKDKLLLTGNPIRKDIFNVDEKKAEACAFFNFTPERKTILVLGGSGGARTINEALEAHVLTFLNAGCQVIWQTGKFYYQDILLKYPEGTHKLLRVTEFLSRMEYAYAMSDLIISRAGAGTISELCIVKRPVVLIPSPHVAEDHQTKNAMSLVNKKAAILIADNAAVDKLGTVVLRLIKDENECNQLSENIGKLALNDSAELIALEVLKLAKN